MLITHVACPRAAYLQGYSHTGLLVCVHHLCMVAVSNIYYSAFSVSSSSGLYISIRCVLLQCPSTQSTLLLKAKIFNYF